MKRFLMLTKAMILSTLREPQTLFWNLIFPVFLLFIYRMIFGGQEINGTNYITWVLPGVIVLNILAYGLIGSSAAMLDMREKGILQRLRATPVPATHMLGAYLVSSLLVCFAQMVVLLLTGAIFFGVQIPLRGLLMALPMIGIAIVTCVALGQLVSSAAPKASVAVAIGQLLYFGQMFITNLVLPVQALPTWLQPIVPYLPSYVVGDLVRSPLQLGQWSPQLGGNLLLAAVYIGLASAIAARQFRWEPKR